MAKVTYIQSQIINCIFSKRLLDICSHMSGLNTATPLAAAYLASQVSQVFSDCFPHKISEIRSYLDAVSAPDSISYDILSRCYFIKFRPVCEADLKAIILRDKPATFFSSA